MLGYFGSEIYRQAPPMPKRVVTTDGRCCSPARTSRTARTSGSPSAGRRSARIWGHGAYVAPDWSADWLHREATWLLDHWAAAVGGKTYAQLPAETQAALRERLKQEIRVQHLQPETGDLVVSATRAAAIQAVSAALRRAVRRRPGTARVAQEPTRFPANAIKTPERRQLMNAFFFWAAWACGTERPGTHITYTQNWPPEPLIDNRPTGSIIVWSVISFVVLLAGVGALVWYFAVQRHKDEEDERRPARRATRCWR